MSHSAPPPSDALREALADLQPVDTRRPGREWALGAAVSVAVAAAFALAIGLRNDLPDLPRGWLVAFGAWWVLGFAGVLHLAFVPRRGSVPPRAGLAGALGLAFGAVAVALGLAFAETTPASTIAPAGIVPFLRYGWPCWVVGMATAVAPVAIAFWYLRGTTPVHTRWLAAGIGAAGGALGGLVLHAHCSITNASHVGLVHGLVPLLGAAAAALGAGILLRARVASR